MSDERRSSPEPGAGEPRSDREVVERLDELTELARNAPGRISEELADLPLRQQAELALRLPPRERLEVLLHAPKPMRLVRSLPDVEFYLTVREVGPTDAIPLVALGSAPQIRHLVDLESWRRDSFDAKRSGAWVALLLESGEPTLRRFLRDADDELLVLLFKKWMRVTQIEDGEPPDRHGHGETESGTESGFLLPDGYHRFAPVIPEHAPAIRRLAEMFIQENPERYHRVIWSAMWDLPSEIEELALQWRQSRLEEHGFPPWDEAIHVYAPPTGVQTHPAPLDVESPDAVPSPRLPLRATPAAHPLVRVFDSLRDEDRERLLHELISLANHLLVADGVDVGEPETHRASVRKAAGYVGIALAARGATDDIGAATVAREVPLIELFREGFGKAVEAQSEARRLTTEGWASMHPRALELLDTPLRPTMTGLLQARPLFHDAAAEGEALAYRDFASMAEIEESRASVRMAEVLGGIMVDRLGLDIVSLFETQRDPGDDAPRFSTLFLTALAWNATRGELRSDPLPHEVLSQFLRTVASGRTADPEAAARALGKFVDHLATVAHLTPGEISALQAFGRACLARLKEECGGLDPGAPVDPRHVSCLVVA